MPASSSSSSSLSSIAESDEERFPKNSFTKPTCEEAGKIDLLLSGHRQVRGQELRCLFSDDNSSLEEDEDLEPLFIYDLPPESIKEHARISAPNIQRSNAVTANDYVSFGDEGTTVTVNAFGSIMQITRSLGYGYSGLFCVHTSGVCGPASPQSRLEQLMQLSKNPDGGIRLNAMGLGDGTRFGPQMPKLDFIFNRWPRFTSQSTSTSGKSDPVRGSNKSEDPKSSRTSLQYFCDKGTVFQRYTFHRNPNALQEVQDSLLYLQRNFLIRTMDSENESAFNDDEVYGDKYVAFSGPKKLGHITAHVITQSDAEQIGIDKEIYESLDGPKAVALIITVFVNGEVQVVHEFSSRLYIQLGERTQKMVERSETVEITIAYRLRVLTIKHDWKQSFIPATALAPMGDYFRQGSAISFQKLRWSPHEHLNFIIQRNLEHILSVCTIPMPKSSRVEEDEMDLTSLALTCGDISGHRVANTAAFFAFKFLMECLRYLCRTSKRPRHYRVDPANCSCVDESNWTCPSCKEVEMYLHSLRGRILQTLQAHLTWTERARSGATLVSPEFWITGKEITGSQARSSLTDVPFEIIKSHSLYQFYLEKKEECGKKEISNSSKESNLRLLSIMQHFAEQETWRMHLGSCIRSWVQTLYESDKGYQYAFCRPHQDGDKKKYHLADHVWICRAVRCVEDLSLGDHLDLTSGISYLAYPHPKSEENKSQEPEKGKRSERLQRIILKRFTTRNPQSQQRMLATSRSSSESRFLFHAKDTSLFFAMDNGFFDQETKRNNRRTNWANKIAVWRETVEAQADHEETQVFEWEKPLYYALALIMSSKRKRINKVPADQTFNITAEILFGLSSSSGLFPGRLNEKHKPVSFEDELERDNYWHATFEIPYILWVYGKDHFETSKAPAFDVQQREMGQLQRPMAKKVEFATFNNMIDKSRLVEVSDDWLREPPAFLNFHCQIDYGTLSFYRKMRKWKNWDFGRVLNSSLSTLSHYGPSEPKGRVFDVAKHISNQDTNSSKPELAKPPQRHDHIKKILGVARSPQTAKKRLIWLPRADKETALTCYLASQQMERDNLSTFFNRHASYEKHFFDDTSAALNEWVTELHLSYFHRTTWDSTKTDSAGEIQGTIPEQSFILMDPPTIPGRLNHNTEGTKILRSVMSFRFIGDFFNRYWTCYFLEFDPVKIQSEDKRRKEKAESKYEAEEEDEGLETLASRLSYLGSGPVREMKSSGRQKQPWQQRKVLELLLFDYMLREIHSNTEKLLDWVRSVILEKNVVLEDGASTVPILEVPFGVRASKTPSPMAEALQTGFHSPLGSGSDGYFSIAERWRFFEQVLQVMEEDLSANLETISFWSSREKDREPQMPRWTQSDEMTYRQVINKLHVMNQRKIRDLDSLKGAIGTFRESLTGKLETMRSDLEYQGSENINLFTYVTVVFMPLGFATGIFSMSDAPTHSVLVNMIKLSLMALAITLFALSNAKTTGTTVVQPIILILRSINNRILSPLLQPFCVLGNLLLACGFIVEFAVKSLFHLFLVIPLTKLLDRWGKYVVKSWNLESIKTSYQGIVVFNRLVVDKKVPLDASKTA